MVVYVEYVFIDNFVIDMLIFKLSSALANIPFSRWRLLFCSFLGAIFALLYPLITADETVIAVAKIAFGFLLTSLAGKFDCAKKYLNFTLVFMTVTFLFGGAVYGIFFILGLNASSEISIGLMILPVFAVYLISQKFLRYLFRKKVKDGFYADAEIIFGSEKIILKGFFDTGNELYDGVSPVIVATKSAILPALSEKTLKNSKRISVTTVAGTSRKILLKPSAVVIYCKDKRNIFYNVSLCLTNEKFDGYDAILHPLLMKNANAKTGDFPDYTENYGDI